MGPRDRTALVPLPPMRPEQAQRLLAPPWIPTMLAASIARACRARPLALPVHLALPHAALGPRFARALHALTGPHGDLLLATDERPELRALPLGATIVIDPTRSWSGPAVSTSGGGPTWPRARRTSARTRASSSRAENGLPR